MYTKPQVTLHQEFESAPAAVVSNLNAFILGANYQLVRFDDADERALSGLGDYARESLAVSYPNKVSDAAVDVGWTRLFATDALLSYATYEADAGVPIVVASDAERSKLRAAPRISTAEAYTPGPTVESAGYHTGGVGLPEAYYLFPAATFGLGSAAGVLNYVSTEGKSGTVAVGANATTAGVVTQGPDGITLDFDNAGSAQAPVTVTFEDDGGDTFTLAAVASRRITHAGFAIDAAAPLRVNIDTDVLGAAYDSSTHTLTVTFTAADTLADIRAELASGLSAGQADFDVEFTLGELSGAGSGDAVTAVDQDATDVLTGADVDVLPIVYRITVFENDVVFATGNDVSRSGELFRNVQVGDRVRVVVGDSDFVTSITALEADINDASVGSLVAATANQASVSGDSLDVGFDGVTAGDDNQRAFDGAATNVNNLGSAKYRYSELSAGILDSDVTVTVTRGGVAGVAEAEVSNAAGTYRRISVPIEAVGDDNGQVYIGSNVYVNFDQGGDDADAEFQVGDVYTVSVAAPYTAISAEALTLSGEYTGTRDTTYTVEVTRGGVFDRAIDVVDGLQVTDGATLEVSLAGYTGGDRDDEYILRCTTGGAATAAVFDLESVGGDIQESVRFAGVGSANSRKLGYRGLTGYFTGSDLTFTAGDYWVLTLRASRPEVRVTDSAGIDQQGVVVVNDGDAVLVGLNGLSITFPANSNTISGISAYGGLILGERFTVAATAAAPGAIQNLILADTIPAADATAGQTLAGDSNTDPTLVKIQLLMYRAEVEIPSIQADPNVAAGAFNFVSDADELTVSGGITLQDNEWVDTDGSRPHLTLFSGSLYVQYRALLSSYSTSLYAVDNVGEVAALLGPAVPENPLAYGVLKAVENSGSSSVYFMAVPTNDLDGYLAVLGRVEATDMVYAFAPLSDDPSILAAVEGHVGNMSGPESRRWRHAFFGLSADSVFPVLDAAIQGGDEWTATIVDNPGQTGEQNTLVTVSDGAQLLSRVRPGDKLRYGYSVDAWGVTTSTEAAVASVTSNTTLLLVSGPDAPIEVGQKVEIHRTRTTGELATAFAAAAGAYNDRRVTAVFPDVLSDGARMVPSMYAAAAIAGLSASVVPQQGLTNTDVNGFDDLPRVYATFSETQLNEIAGGGALIIAQDLVGGAIYVRHQITTDSSGNIAKKELSMVRAMDAVSYYFARRFRPFIGQYNVTPQLISQLDSNARHGISYLTDLTAVGTAGALLLAEGTEVVLVEPHPEARDRVLITMNLALPAPLNVIETYLVSV